MEIGENYCKTRENKNKYAICALENIFLLFN